MDRIVEYLKSLQGSYSGVFVLFWGAMLVTCISLWVLESRKNTITLKAETRLFWVFGLLMVAFAALRPIGIARDDLAYVDIYNTVCPTLTCNQWIQGTRDWGWYSSVGLLKSLVPDLRVMLWLGAAALLAKLGVIYSLSRRPLLTLLLYSGVFYEVQDLTAWRVSLAIAFFMAAIWLIVRSRTYLNAWTLFCCGLFHKQAFVAPLILLGGALRKKVWWLTIACFAPIVLMIFGVYPQLHEIFSSKSGEFQQVAVAQALDSYLAAKNAGVYQGWRTAPLVVYPQIFLMLWLVIRDKASNERLKSLIAGCLAMGSLFLWGFASLPDAQIRFFEFFMVPTVLLVGMRRLNGLELISLVAVSGAYLIKYNLVAHLLGA